MVPSLTATQISISSQTFTSHVCVYLCIFFHSKNAFLWTQVVSVRGGPECLGHRPTFPHGHILLHPQCGSHRRSAIGGKLRGIYIMDTQKKFPPLLEFCWNSSLFFGDFFAVIKTYIKQVNEIRIVSTFLLLFPFLLPFSSLSSIAPSKVFPVFFVLFSGILKCYIHLW